MNVTELAVAAVTCLPLFTLHAYWVLKYFPYLFS